MSAGEGNERTSPVGFDVEGDAYDRFMGRYSRSLAAPFADAAGVRRGQTVLDVGCGAGALTGELVARLGADHVIAIDPSPPFVAACRERHPGVAVRAGAAEDIPLGAASVDVALAQLVIPFVADPPRAVREMARVTRTGGRVATCVWDTVTGGMELLSHYWAAAREVDGTAPGDPRGPHLQSAEGLGGLLASAGLAGVETGTLVVEARYEGFEDLWTGIMDGVGPVGVHAVSLSTERRDEVRRRLSARLGQPRGPFTLSAAAWFAAGRVM